MESPNIELLVRQLQSLKYDPNATRVFELMSGGFCWSDERPDAYDDVVLGYAFRFLLGYRASLIRATPNDTLRSVWDLVQARCPNWPGFRPERLDRELSTELDSENRRAMRRLLAMVRLNERNAKKPNKIIG